MPTLPKVTFNDDNDKPADKKEKQIRFPMLSSPQIARSTSSPSSREKVRLAPNHSAMHWEAYKKSHNMKNIDPSTFPIRITKKELAIHNKEDDCWVALGGKIYNITDYLAYHPGGVKILLKYAGTECTAIFMKYHRWVNFERILDMCFLGFLE